MMLDGAQIEKMMMILVDNAIDACDAGGSVTIDTRLRAPQDMVTITVSDTGRGIAPEHLGKIFTPFFTTKETGKGTGLGLAIAHGLAKMHAGDITAESRPHTGTTFSVTLPIDLDEPVKGRASPADVPNHDNMTPPTRRRKHESQEDGITLRR